MDTTARAVEELDLDLPEIMLTELRGQTFKTNQRFHRLATKRSHQRIQRRLASCVACLANPSQNPQESEPHENDGAEPWQNGIAERGVGSAGREMRDHFMPLNE